FITTSNFSQDAREYVSNIDLKIVLINGKQLTQFMIDYNVGISTIRTYEIKKIDSDYFSED
ncbi:MAG: restriction endonuclease, partial [Microcoleaceae cyanobacterium]